MQTTPHLQEQARLLGHAASDNDVQQVLSILSAYPDVVHVRGGIMQSTPLHFAADRGLFEIATYLIEAGADVNAREGATGTTPLHWAALSGQIEIVKLLLAHRADREATDEWHDLSPLGWAAAVTSTPRLEIVDYLLEQGAHLDIFSALALGRAEDVRALAVANPAVLQKRMNFFENARSPLHFATLRKLTDMIPLLAACGADINGRTAWGQTALCLASAAKNTEIVDILLRLGAETDLSTLLISGQIAEAKMLLEQRPGLLRSTEGYPLLLHLAAQDNLGDAAGLLLEYGADHSALASMVVDELLCQVTPLHRAAIRGSAQTLRVLLDHGADPNRLATGYWEVTPLHLAVWRDHTEAASLLLQYGADPLLKNPLT